MKNYIGDFEGLKMFYILSHYPNGRPAIVATSVDKNGFEDDYAVVTINLPDRELPSDCPINIEEATSAYGFIDADLTEEFKSFLREKNIISDPIATVQYNMGRYELCKILVA